MLEFLCIVVLVVREARFSVDSCRVACVASYFSCRSYSFCPVLFIWITKSARTRPKYTLSANMPPQSQEPGGMSKVLLLTWRTLSGLRNGRSLLTTILHHFLGPSYQASMPHVFSEVSSAVWSGLSECRWQSAIVVLKRSRERVWVTLGF